MADSGADFVKGKHCWHIFVAGRFGGLVSLHWVGQGFIIRGRKVMSAEVAS